MKLLSVLIDRGLTVEIEGDNLAIYRAELLTDELRQFIRTHKAQLLEELRQGQQIDDVPESVRRSLNSAADLIEAGLPLVTGPKDDTGFIDSALLYRSAEDKSALLNEYLNRWRQAELKETSPHQKENAGRFAANVWLRGKMH